MKNRLLLSFVRTVLNFYVFRVLKLQVMGRENIPVSGAVIVAPNHKSNWDPPVIGVAIQHRIVHYMAKEELFRNPLLGWALKQFGTFPVKRGDVDNAAIRRAVRELKDGQALGIFPEGTRIAGEELGPFHSGMASLALLTGTPILPVAVMGTKDLPKRTAKATVIFGKLIKVEKEKPTKEKTEMLNGLVRQELERLMTTVSE